MAPRVKLVPSIRADAASGLGVRRGIVPIFVPPGDKPARFRISFMRTAVGSGIR